MRYFRGAAGVLLLCAATAAQTPQPIKLEVVSANVNLESHQLTIELHNQSDKIAVAYMLEIKEFDVSGKSLADTKTGWDYLYFNPADIPDQRERNLIPPGKTARLDPMTSTETFSAEVSVLAVVYQDRTFQGTESAVFPLFDVRARTAQKLQKAAALMHGTYPVTPEAVRAAVQSLRALDCGSVNGALVNKVNLPVDVLYKERPLPEMGVPDKKAWQETADSLSEESAFFAAQARQVHP
jgi:hypothetical protein